jgi:AraC family transcriptional regulator
MNAAVVTKSARAPMVADQALANATTSLSLLDIAVDPAEFVEHPNPHLKIAIVLEASSVNVGWQTATGRTMQAQVMRNTSSIMPASMPYRTHWQRGGRMLLMSFSHDFLRNRDAVIGRTAGDLRAAWSQSDPFLAQLSLSVLAAQRRQTADATYMDAAAEVAMMHLVNRYGGGDTAHYEPLLPKHIVRVIDMIEAHLDEPLSLATLAAAANTSTYGFAHAFKRAVGTPPHQYVLLRRCERAKHLLAHTAMPIAEVAIALGFASQAHLTAAFSKATGFTPAKFRRAMQSPKLDSVHAHPLL